MNTLHMTEEQYAAYEKRRLTARVVSFPENAPEPRKPKLPKPPRVPQPKLSNEDRLAMQLNEAGVHLERQYAWLKGRKYRADFASPQHNLIIELDGAAHRIKGRFRSDILKSQDALLNGFWLLRIASDQVRMNSAVPIIKAAMAAITAGKACF